MLSLSQAGADNFIKPEIIEPDQGTDWRCLIYQEITGIESRSGCRHLFHKSESAGRN